MTSVEPIDPASPTAQTVAATLESFDRMTDPSALFPRILAHAPGYADALWGAMAEALFEGSVNHSLKELIRIQLATTAGDPYFAGIRSQQAIEAGLTEARIQAALGDFENDRQFTDAEKWALRYAYTMYRQPEKINAAFYDDGKQHFTEAEIMEIGGLIAVHYGMYVFMRTLQNDAEPS